MGVFGAFPVLCFVWISSVRLLVSYVLWVRVLVTLDLLLVDGRTRVVGGDGSSFSWPRLPHSCIIHCFNPQCFCVFPVLYFVPFVPGPV